MIPAFQLLSRIALAILFAMAGVAHFKDPDSFAKIVPPVFGRPYFWVYLSGIGEILGAVGLLLPGTQRLAAVGLVVLLLAVFPANIYMATHGVTFHGFPKEPWQGWARLPVQFVLIAWLLWCCPASS